MLRGSIGTSITAAVLPSDRIIQSMGLNTLNATTDINVFHLRGLQVYQRSTTAVSLRLVRHRNDQLHATNTAPGRYNYYGNEITGNTISPAIITWATQPTVIDAPPLASFNLSGTVGDSAHIMFDKPIEVSMTLLTGDPNRCIGLQLVNSAITYDLDVTWIWEYSRVL